MQGSDRLATWSLTAARRAAGPASAALLAVAVGAASVAPARATVLFSEYFDSPALIGPAIGVTYNFTDRFGPADFFQAKQVGGWNFSGQAWIAQSRANHDGALYLNEGIGGGVDGGVASHAIGGLTPGQTYFVSFLTSGDNVPGEAWVLNLLANGSQILTVNGVDEASGSNPGQTNTVTFVASSTSETLTFAQASVTGASPIIDNFVVTDDGVVPSPPPPPGNGGGDGGGGSVMPEPASWALMIAGFGLAGVGLRARRRAALM